MARMPPAKCSFCGKDQDRVRKLVAGPGVYICSECIELCDQIMDAGDETSPDVAPSPDQSTWRAMSPQNPDVVELRTLQRQVASVARRLSALVEGMEDERDDARE